MVDCFCRASFTTFHISLQSQYCTAMSTSVNWFCIFQLLQSMHTTIIL